MKKKLIINFFQIIFLSLLLNNVSYAGQKIIYLGESIWDLKTPDWKRYTAFYFRENGTCHLSWSEGIWGNKSEKNCRWSQEGPEIQISYGKNLETFVNGYINKDYFRGKIKYNNGYATTISGFVEHYEKVYKNWISPEEQKRIDEEKRRIEYQKELQRKAKEYEKKRLAEAKKNNTQSNSNSSGRDRAKQVASYKGEVAMKGFMSGLIGLAIGFGIYSIMDRKIKKKINDKYFLGAAFFIGWILSKFI